MLTGEFGGQHPPHDALVTALDAMRGRESVDAILADNASPEKARETLAAVQRVVDAMLRGSVRPRIPKKH